MGKGNTRIAHGFPIDEDFDPIDGLAPRQHPALDKAGLAIEKAVPGHIQAAGNLFASGKGDVARKYERQQDVERGKLAQEGDQAPAPDNAERHFERQADGA